MIPYHYDKRYCHRYQKESMMANKKTNNINASDGTSNKDDGRTFDPYEVKYVPVYQQDLPGVIVKAKGEGRSFAKFTEDVNAFLDEDSKITPAFFSRIMNYKIQNPIKTEIIKAIAKTSDNKFEANYTDLMYANGMIRYRSPEEISESLRRQEKSMERQKQREKLLEETIPGIIKGEMGKSGAMFRDGCKRVHMDVSDDNQFGLEFRYRADFGISLWTEEDRIESWLFYINSRGSGFTPLDSREEASKDVDDSDPFKDRVKPSEEMNVIMRNAGAFFLLDAWKPELLKEVRVSFAFIRPETFELYYNQLKDVEVNTYFSLLLLDLDKNNVVEERKLGENRKSPFDSCNGKSSDEQEEFEIIKNKEWEEEKEKQIKENKKIGRRE